jgi:hypothetical protein
MTDDRLSKVLDLIEVRGVVTGTAVARGRWRTRRPVEDEIRSTSTRATWRC